ncbi:hypothetical protein JCM10449v2_002384 [Rhodotorula kratochvilovae]
MDALHRPVSPLSSPQAHLLPPAAVDWQRVLDPALEHSSDKEFSSASCSDSSAPGSFTLASPPLLPIETPFHQPHSLGLLQYPPQPAHTSYAGPKQYDPYDGRVPQDYTAQNPPSFRLFQDNASHQYPSPAPTEPQYYLPPSLASSALYLPEYLTPGCTVGDVLARVPSAMPAAGQPGSSRQGNTQDWSLVNPIDSAAPSSLLVPAPPPPTKPFIAKLHAMLAHPDEYADVLTWDASGEVVVVRECERIVSEVFPGVFGHGNFASFTRQLNVYSFHRHPPSLLPTLLDLPASALSGYSAWSHPHFTRANNPAALHLLVPRPSKARVEAKRARAAGAGAAEEEGEGMGRRGRKKARKDAVEEEA